MDFSSLGWHEEFHSFPFFSRAFDLSFASVLLCHSSEKVGGYYCRGGLKPFPPAGGEGLQGTGRLWPSGVRADHKTNTEDASLAPVLHKHCTASVLHITTLFSCLYTKDSAGNLTGTSLHSSRVLHSLHCREVGAQVSAWSNDSEHVDTIYDFVVTRNLYDRHTGDDISSTGLA